MDNNGQVYLILWSKKAEFTRVNWLIGVLQPLLDVSELMSGRIRSSFETHMIEGEPLYIQISSRTHVR